ncbi:hypothetical protein IRT45_24955 [Nocardia sp. BSTN01]|uniref:hypothetical protein n=1 Tax=Nocardia sp. BSTN01 TaxID=2783665 RepID=UPI00188F9EA3|nr:hypothetical protein [Nocardia sp. BSTN01]MBF5000397.1 hypothetical protein [Nocardia sp. BSTN01]
MNARVIQYRTHPEAAEENRRLIEDVVREVGQAGPGLRYAAFVLEDGVTFVHFAALDDPDRLASISAFGVFREHLEDRVVPGSRTETKLDVIGFSVKNSSEA